MTRAQSYQALGRLFSYPEKREEIEASLDCVTASLDSSGADSPAGPFAEFLKQADLARLQEDYVATFDFDPARAPYLGHHLFSDHQKRAAYLISLQREFARFGFTGQGRELADHLSVLLGFLSHLSDSGQDEDRRLVIAEDVLPGVRKLVSQKELAQSHWHCLVSCAERLMDADCREVQPC